MANSSPWVTLDRKSEQLPPLLVRSSFSQAGYKICITDLSHVWTEEITKEGILDRADDRGCSIDPRQDDEQFEILQGKVKSALRQEEGTVITIAKLGRDGLRLLLSAPLPSPLPDFEWSVNLKLQSIERIETDLVTPLLRQAQGLQILIDLLISEIHDKDRIIAKVTDRLENSGNDLTTVFPGVSNVKTTRKKSQREQLARHVKGLSEFDENDWRGRNLTAARFNIPVKDLDTVLLQLPDATLPQFAEPDWWKHVEIKLVADRSGHIPNASTQIQTNACPVMSLAGGSTRPDEDVTMADNEFQRQDTPPSLHETNRKPLKSQDHGDPPARDIQVSSRTTQQSFRHDSYKSVPLGSHDDSTDDDEDVGDMQKVGSMVEPASDQMRPDQTGETRKEATGDSSTDSDTADSGSPPKVKATKLGRVGGQKKPSVLTNASQNNMTTRPRAKAPETGSESHQQDVQVAAKVVIEPKQSHTKLGTIGGRKPLRQEAPSLENEKEVPTTPKMSVKLGVIGGKKKDVRRSTEPDAPPSAGHAVQATTRSPSVEIDPAKRAERRRLELKRELEQKAKAPAKKKRMF